MGDITCGCGRKIPMFEPIWRCHDCKKVVCGECMSGKTSNRLEFLCPDCTTERKGKIIKVKTTLHGDQENAFKAWVIMDKQDNIMMFEVCGQLMMGYNRSIEPIVKMADILIQDRLILLSGFYIGRAYIPLSIEMPPLKVRMNETDIRVMR
jgi:hypothetical protein